MSRTLSRSPCGAKMARKRPAQSRYYSAGVARRSSGRVAENVQNKSCTALKTGLFLSTDFGYRAPLAPPGTRSLEHRGAGTPAKQKALSKPRKNQSGHPRLCDSEAEQI